MTHLGSIALLWVSPLWLLAQQSVVLDAHTAEPIVYAHVLFYKNQQLVEGSYTDERGFLYVPSSAFDSVYFSSMGYRPLQLAANDLSDTTRLVPETTTLRPVTVYSSEAPTEYLGVEKERPLSNHRAYEGSQEVQFIANPWAAERKIKSFQFWIKRLRTRATAHFRVVLFANEGGRPSERPFAEKLVAMDSLKGRALEIDLRKQHLWLPKEGAFVGIEWLGCAHKRPQTGAERSPDHCPMAVLTREMAGKPPAETLYFRDALQRRVWIDISEYLTVDYHYRLVMGLRVFR